MPPTSPATERVLIAVRDDDYCAAALRVGGMYAIRHHLPAEVYAVSEPAPLPWPAMPVFVDAVVTGQRQWMGERVRHRMAEVMPDFEAAVVTQVGSPAEAITDRAESIGATLIVLGLGRHDPVIRMVGADTVISVIRHAHVPVLAVAVDAQTQTTVLMLATDFSVAAADAARAALRLAMDDAYVHLVHVTPVLDATIEARVRRQLAEWSHELPLPPRGSVALHVQCGDPAHELTSFARTHGVELIGLGRHSKGLVERLRLGSVAESVLRHASCSVLVAPPYHSVSRTPSR